MFKHLMIAIIFSFFFSSIETHNVLTYPFARNHYVSGYPTDHVPASRIWQAGAPIEPLNGRNDSEFTCRNRPQESPKSEIEAGKTLEVHYDVWASHPGDCAIYVSYDIDPIPDAEKRWIKIHDWKECGCIDERSPCEFVPLIGYYPRKVNITIPDWLPPSDHAIFRYEMYATHMRFNNKDRPFMLVELYATCADVVIKNKNENVLKVLPTPFYKVMNHLPTEPEKYRAQWDLAGPTAFPANSGPGVAGGEPLFLLLNSTNVTQNQSSSTNKTTNVTVVNNSDVNLPEDNKICNKTGRGLTIQEIDQVWKMHNEIRNKIARGDERNMPQATNIPALIWDRNLSIKAQTLADQCPFDYDDKSINYVNMQFNLYIDRQPQYSDIKAEKGVTYWYHLMKNYSGALVYRKSDPAFGYLNLVGSFITKLG